MILNKFAEELERQSVWWALASFVIANIGILFFEPIEWSGGHYNAFTLTWFITGFAFLFIKFALYLVSQTSGGGKK